MNLKRTKLRDAINFALCVGATSLIGTGMAFAQTSTDATATADKSDTKTLEKVYVTGSNIKQVDIESSQPVFSVSRADMQAQGLTSVGDVIQNITTNGSALNTTFNNGGNGETQVSLRNLGSNRTLVLVDGHRWVGGTGLGGAVDLNTIPTAAVERIDVLKDGASTIYGSDALAGVVNVILRKDYEGAEANAYFGQFDKGDGGREAFDVSVGSVSDRWSAMLGISYVKEKPVFAGSRAISAVPVFGANPNTGYSFSPPPGNFSIFNGPGLTYAFSAPNNQYGFFQPAPGTPLGYTNGYSFYNFAPVNYLLTPNERTSVFGKASFNITDNVRFRSTVTLNRRTSEQLLASTPLVNDASNGVDSQVGISQFSIYNPTGYDINEFFRRMTETGGRSFKQDVRTTAIDVGFDGTLNIADKPFDWEAGYFYGENKNNQSTDGIFQTSRVLTAVGPSMLDANGNPVCVSTPGDINTVIGGCIPLNLLAGAGAIPANQIASVSFTAHDAFIYTMKNYYGNISGDLFELPAGALSAAFGVTHRTESGSDSPDALINSGDSSGNNRTATLGGYSLDEAYLELAIPLLKDVTFAKLLDVSVATRYSNYSNFGSTNNAKFGFKWKPIDDLLVRGNWSQGFRAPSVSELFTGQSDSFPSVTDPCAGQVNGTIQTPAPACTTAGIPAYNQVNSQIGIKIGGNPNLLPETSVSKTLGLVYSPSYFEGFSASLDWYKIDIENTITTQSASAVLNGCYLAGVQAACNLITRSSTGAISNLLAVPANLGNLTTEGYDFTAKYRLPDTAWGTFSWTLDTTYVADYSQDADGDGVVTEDPVSGEAGNQVGEYFGPVFVNNWRIRANLMTRWEMGDWGATWFVRYYSPQEEDCTPLSTANTNKLCSDPFRTTQLDGHLTLDERPQNHIPSALYNDLSAYWKAPWNATVTVGVNNIFNRNPPISYTSFANSFDPSQEVPGRFFYMSYNQKF